MRADAFLEDESKRRAMLGLDRVLQAIDGPQETRVVINGRSVLSLCSNNYLGLANHPAVIEAAVRAARDYGVGAGAARLISGSMRPHHDLEERLAAFKRTQRCLLFSSGYHANLGAIAALVGQGDAVFSDSLNHASLIDGCRLSHAAVHVYSHNDVEALETALRQARCRRRLVVTETLFSMDGDTAPLHEICDLARRHNAMVMVDEAHATGVFGPQGAGLVEELELAQSVTVQMGTLGKALGSFGAYIAGDAKLISHLVNCARTFMFTTALPPPVVAAASAALSIVEKEPSRRATVRQRASRLRAGLRMLDYHLPGPDTHILPVVIGDTATTMRVSETLLEHGVLALGIRPPTVPEGTARIRATVMATHTEADIDQAVEAFRKASPTHQAYIK